MGSFYRAKPIASRCCCCAATGRAVDRQVAADVASALSNNVWALPMVWHWQLMLGLLGAALLLAAFVPALRLAVTGGAIVSKAGYIAVSFMADIQLGAAQWLEAGLLVSLTGAFAVFLREAVQQARWDGVLPFQFQAKI